MLVATASRCKKTGPPGPPGPPHGLPHFLPRPAPGPCPDNRIDAKLKAHIKELTDEFGLNVTVIVHELGKELADDRTSSLVEWMD